MLNEHKKNKESSDEDQLVDEELSHLNTKDAEAVKKIIGDHPEVIANSFEDVRRSAVSDTHRFELTSQNPECRRGRSMSPSHYEVIHKKIDRMHLAGIIIPVASSWTSTAVIATKKDGSLRFCVDHRNLNSVVHADRWPLLRVDEFLNKWRENYMFTMQHLF